MLGKFVDRVREKSPRIHCITNYVTANDCANILLACGGSPIMASDPEEVEEITARCDGLVLNLGTPDHRILPGMFAAGKAAARLGHPIVFDPVGVGASRLRTETAIRLLREVPFSVIRGNISEIRTLALGQIGTTGVDADAADRVDEGSLDETVRFLKEFSARTEAVIAVTGAIDIVTDAERAFCIRNGHSSMAMVTGTGCQLTALTAAFVAASPEKKLEAAAAAVCVMGLCGENAYARLSGPDGSAALRGYIVDGVSRMTAEELERGANYEVR